MHGRLLRARETGNRGCCERPAHRQFKDTDLKAWHKLPQGRQSSSNDDDPFELTKTGRFTSACVALCLAATTRIARLLAAHNNIHELVYIATRSVCGVSKTIPRYGIASRVLRACTTDPRNNLVKQPMRRRIRLCFQTSNISINVDPKPLLHVLR